MFISDQPCGSIRVEVEHKMADVLGSCCLNDYFVARHTQRIRRRYISMLVQGMDALYEYKYEIIRVRVPYLN